MLLKLLEAKTEKYFSMHKKIHYLGFWGAIFFLWVLFFPYAGITDDAQLYALQALSHVEPEYYKNDIFLRFGSQDQFTLFSPLYATLITLFGLEWASAFLALVGHILFFSAAFLLARQIMPYGLAVFALGLVMVVSSYYGAERVFHYIEKFTTSRMLAEAFVLFSVAAWVNQKHILAAGLLLVACLLHPLMAAAGLVFLSSVFYVTHWRSASLIGVITCALLLLIFYSGSWLAPLQFDSEWLYLVERYSARLFFHFWVVDDFANALVPLISLLIAVWSLSGEREKKLAIAALFTGIMALLVQIVGEFLHIALVIQGQAWRWFWLVTVLAIVLLPKLIVVIWQQKPVGKIIVISLISAWLMRSQLVGLVIAIWALILVSAFKSNWGSAFFLRFAKWITLVFGFLPWILLIGVSHFHIDVLIALFKGARLQDFFGIWHESAFPFYLLLIFTLICFSHRKALHLSLAVGFFLAAFMAFWCWGKSWLPENTGRMGFEHLAELRETIPVGEDVFALGAPTDIWLGLQRPSYLSSIQTAGIVFVRETAIEVDRRQKAISLVCPNSKDILTCQNAWTAGEVDFSQFCKTAGVRFVMSPTVINATGLSEVTFSDEHALPHLYLCVTAGL